MNVCEISIMCADKVEIAATKYPPSIDIKAAVIIAPATGIKRQFYANFATYLANNGYGVLTFDNRGIGESLTGKIQHSKADIQAWGEKDLPAVLAQLKQAFPDTRYHLIGHSAGGQLVGLMPNANELSSLFNVACSSGSLKNMHWLHKPKAHFFMNFFIPLSNRIFGYTKSH